jgi:hypothetical protein
MSIAIVVLALFGRRIGVFAFIFLGRVSLGILFEE